MRQYFTTNSIWNVNFHNSLTKLLLLRDGSIYRYRNYNICFICNRYFLHLTRLFENYGIWNVKGLIYYFIINYHHKVALAYIHVGYTTIYYDKFCLKALLTLIVRWLTVACSSTYRYFIDNIVLFVVDASPILAAAVALWVRAVAPQAEGWVFKS